jgi:hypothetical protein
MPLPISFLSLTLNDNTDTPRQESSTTEVAVTTITAGNFAAQATLHSDLINALEGVTIGNPAKSELIANRERISDAKASSQLAQKENRWLLRYHGVTNFRKYVVTLGTADLTQLVSGTEFLDLSGGTGAALKTAFEAVVKDPNDASEAVVLDSVQYVVR